MNVINRSGSLPVPGHLAVFTDGTTLEDGGTVTAGDLLMATATDTWGRRAAVAAGKVLASAGVGTAPAYTDTPSVLGLNLGGTSATTALTQVAFTKLVTAIPDATPTTALTVTIPNAAHAAVLKVKVLGSIGAGGTVGAFEASAAGDLLVVVTRVAGVAAVKAAATLAEATGSATLASGAALTLAAGVSAISGGVTAVNTFTLTVTLTKASGASDNHQAVLFVEVLNSNASGVTVA